MTTTNTPYRKQYDENGTLTNPIKSNYTTGPSDRRQRRDHKRPFNNRKNMSVRVYGAFRYNERFQRIRLSSGRLKYILHFDLAKNK